VGRRRAFAGENPVATVRYRVDDGPWQDALIASPEMPGAWVRWQFGWNPEPGEHTLRVRATDDRGNTQPDSTSWNGLATSTIRCWPISSASNPRRTSRLCRERAMHRDCR
jgi:hypothetical protein